MDAAPCQVHVLAANSICGDTSVGVSLHNVSFSEILEGLGRAKFVESAQGGVCGKEGGEIGDPERITTTETTIIYAEVKG